MQEEIWVDVKGYEGLYQISNQSRLKNKVGKIVTPIINKAGYYRHNLSNKSKRQEKLVHRLVAEHFIPNPDNLPCIHHIDHNKLNNAIDNLMWCTHKQNIQLNFDNPATLAGRVTKETVTPAWRKMISDSLPKGKKHPKFEGYYLVGDRFFESSLAAEKALGIHHNVIQNRCKNTKPPGFDFIPIQPKNS